MSGSVSAGIGGEASASKIKKLELSSSVSSMRVTQSKTPEGYFRWILEPRASQFLLGRPWNALKQPRLKLVDQRKDRSRGIPPTVRVEVWCRREDLAIGDLEIKDEGLWQTVKRKAGFKNRLAAAESYIRERLSEEGLEVNNIEDIFGQMTLGSTTAESN